MIALPLAAALPAAEFISAAGRRFRVSERTLGHESAFCRWAERQARAELDDLRGVLSDREYAVLLADHERKTWGWADDHVQILAASPAGRRYLAVLACGEDVSDDALPAVLACMDALNKPSREEYGGVAGGVELSDWHVVLILEDRGYRRNDIAALPRRYVRALLAVERDEHGNFAFLKPNRGSGLPPADHKRQVREVLFRRGLPDWLIEEMINGRR